MEEACYIFYNAYRLKLDSDTDGQFAPKEPAECYVYLSSLATGFARDKEDYTVLGTEIGGTVLIAPDSPMFFKIDALLT